jgi:branched-chain amino acid transport system substrate-binding protein
MVYSCTPMRVLAILLLALGLGAAESTPILVGLDAEFGHQASASAQAIERGMRLAIDGINASGGVLGRPLRLEKRDNRSMPGKAEADFRELAALPDLVAVMGGKFSTAVMPCVPLAHDLGVPFLLPWSSADALIDHGRTPSWTFRLSLRDSWVAPALIERAGRDRRLGFLLPANAWGRSNEAAIRTHLAATGRTAPVIAWYPFGAETMIGPWTALLEAGAEVVVLVANEGEGAVLVRELGAAPVTARRPLVCHWGLTGGDFPRLAGPGLARLDLQVIQTFSFLRDGGPVRDQVLAALQAEGATAGGRAVIGAVGLAQAYDLTHLLARAVAQAGSTDRAAIRSALEHLGPHDGLVGRLERPFTPDRHEALDPSRLFFCRWDAEGVLRPAGP